MSAQTEPMGETRLGRFAPHADKKRRSSREHRWFTPYLFVAPALMVYGAFLLYPLGRAAHLSLFEWDGMSRGVFVGFRNYVALATDDRLRSSFVHAGVLIIFYCVLPLLAGLLLAAVLNRARVFPHGGLCAAGYCDGGGGNRVAGNLFLQWPAQLGVAGYRA